MNDVAWVQLKNIVLIIAAVAGVYFISGWMILILMLYTTVEGETQ